jgi:RNA polymerase sigma factor (sigma-70 family)
MPESLPPQVSALLSEEDQSARNGAWAAFLEEYSRLLLQTARRASSDYDEAMDRYAFILDQLQEGDYRRLRAFTASGKGKFTTWLVVVARRLCVDQHRRRFGRPQGKVDSGAESVELAARRKLVGFMAVELDVDQLEDQGSPDPEVALVTRERRRLLGEVIAALDTSDQLLLTLRFEDEVPVEKIGRMIGSPSRFHVHRRLKRILSNLRSALEEKGISEP